MVSSAPSELIVFIATTIVVTSATGVFALTTDDVMDTVVARGHGHAERVGTDIMIVNDPGAVPTSPLIVYVKNIGVTVLDENATTILVNGRFAAPDDVRLQAGATAWGPGDVVQYRVPDAVIPLPTGDHGVRVVTENGRSAELRFRVVT